MIAQISTSPFPSSIQFKDYFVGKSGVKVRFYSKKNASPSLLLYAHGGGWVCGSVDVYHSYCAHLADQLDVTVAAIEYRLAPEHPYPAALEDLQVVYEWLLNHPVYKKAPLLLGGDSAGGNLVTSLTLFGKNKGLPLPKAVLLICPALDLKLSSLEKSLHYTPSYFFKILFFLTIPIARIFMRYFRAAYLPLGQDPTHPTISPFYHTDLSGFPPTILIDSTGDVLYWENCHFSDQLQKSNCKVYHKTVDKMPHIFIFFRRFFYPQITETLQWVKKCLKQISS